MLFFNVQWDIFNKCHKLYPSHSLGGLPTLNFGGWSEELCKGNIAQFQYNCCFPHDVMVSENDVLELTLQVWSRMNQSHPIGNVSFAEVPFVQRYT